MAGSVLFAAASLGVADSPAQQPDHKPPRQKPIAPLVDEPAPPKPADPPRTRMGKLLDFLGSLGDLGDALVGDFKHMTKMETKFFDKVLTPALGTVDREQEPRLGAWLMGLQPGTNRNLIPVSMTMIFFDDFDPQTNGRLGVRRDDNPAPETPRSALTTARIPSKVGPPHVVFEAVVEQRSRPGEESLHLYKVHMEMALCNDLFVRKLHTVTEIK